MNWRRTSMSREARVPYVYAGQFKSRINIASS